MPSSPASFMLEAMFPTTGIIIEVIATVNITFLPAKLYLLITYPVMHGIITPSAVTAAVYHSELKIIPTKSVVPSPAFSIVKASA